MWQHRQFQVLLGVFLFGYQWGRFTILQKNLVIYRSHSGGAYKTQPDISFVNDTLFPTVDLTGSFTILGWLNPSDQTWWRTFVSIESADSDTSLLNVALPPNSMQIYFAYMTSNQVQGRDNVYTQITAPGPNVDFHFAIAKNGTQFYIYLNGVQQSFNYTIKAQIFDPPTVSCCPMSFLHEL